MVAGQFAKGWEWEGKTSSIEGEIYCNPYPKCSSGNPSNTTRCCPVNTADTKIKNTGRGTNKGNVLNLLETAIERLYLQSFFGVFSIVDYKGYCTLILNHCPCDILKLPFNDQAGLRAVRNTHWSFNTQ